MEAPEKLYLIQDNGLICYCRNNEDDIEYTRTDVAIEKAMKWLDKELPVTDLSSSNLFDIEFKVLDEESKRVFIEEFRKYMKGE